MARSDSRLGTWQVLLTISMVLTPVSAHGKSTGVPPCACVYLNTRVFVRKSTQVHGSAITCMIWKMAIAAYRARGSHVIFNLDIRGYYYVISLIDR